MDAFIEGYVQKLFHQVLFPVIRNVSLLEAVKQVVDLRDLHWEDRVARFRDAVLAVHFVNPRFLAIPRKDILLKWLNDRYISFKLLLREAILKEYTKENVLKLVINRSIQ